MDKRIQNIEHDTDGWWVYLKPGYVVRDEGTHAIVEDRKRDALDKMHLVAPCECDECQRLLAPASGHRRSEGVQLSSAKRGYSRDFKPHGDTGKRYLLDKIPAGLWADVRAKAKREGVSLRALILQLLKEWTER